MSKREFNFHPFEHIPFAVIFVGIDGQIKFANDSSKKFFPVLAKCESTSILSLLRDSSGSPLEIPLLETTQTEVLIGEGIDFGGCDERLAISVNTVEGGSLCIIQSISSVGSMSGVLNPYNTDALTTLPNRQILIDRMDFAIRNGRRAEDACFAVLYIDLDKFKPINDTYGHAIGDLILKEVAARLKKCLRDSDTVARYGGDEFVALLSNLRAKEDSSLVAERIVDFISREIKIGDGVFNVGASVGIAVWPQDAQTVEGLLEAADKAMYSSKSIGGNTVRFFDAEMNAIAQERATMESELRVALREKQFVLHFQPQFCAEKDRIIGAEALIRWKHPTKGMVPPAHFIRVAEETNVITPIGDWVLSEAIAQAKRWLDQGHRLRVAVNLSARQFVDALPGRVEEELKRAKLPPELIELELTESFLVADLSKATKIIERLRSIGVRVALDDFGTGFSSLQYLCNFPVDTIKIDRTFVGSSEEVANERMVQAILDIAKNFNLDTLAEGVETQAQLDKLRRSGCGSWQGFLRSGAIGPVEFISYLESFQGSKKLALAAVA
jgi:diguanylate cyclase (GGDEF)-like protein